MRPGNGLGQLENTTGPGLRFFKRLNELHIDFNAHVKKTIERTVVVEEVRQQILKLLAYEDCRRAILPTKESGDLNQYMKTCNNILSKTRKMQLMVETMVTAYHKRNENSGMTMKCHLKKNCKQL